MLTGYWTKSTVTSGVCIYRIGELAKMAGVTPNTIRCYEKQQIMEHEVRTEGRSRLYTEDDLQRLKFIRHTRQLSFSPESIRELLSVRIDPEHHICQKLKGIVQERSQGIETWIIELQSMQRSLQRLNDTCYETTRSSVYCLASKTLEQGVSGVGSGCWLFALAELHPRHKITNWSLYEPILAY